jgi:sec-independent protein translocase protein TatB
MFNIGWSEYLVIAVIALVAIGPKELPGVLRMVGQWVAKARKMAAEFQGQFHEAMREAEMADLKKSFDEVKEAASGFSSGNIMTSLQNQANSALGVDDKPAASVEATTSAEATTSTEQAATPPVEPAASEPLAITPPGEAASAASEEHTTAAETEAPREAKAS